MRDQSDEPIYKFNDKNMRWIVRQDFKRGRVCAFNQSHKRKTCGGVLEIISREIKVGGSVYDIIEAHVKQKNDHLKIIKRENESRFDEYRKIDEKEMEKFIKKNLGELPIHPFLKQLALNDLLWDFDAVSL